jgi:Icc-related predicted phosphoesterase
MRVLSLSDIVVQQIYNPHIRQRFSEVDLILGCGDLPYYYQEFVLSVLDVPLFFVRGNHDVLAEEHNSESRSGPRGGTDLHRRVVRYSGVLIAGVEGSLRYRPGPFQYTQSEMWQHVYTLVPKLFRNKLAWGRYLDVFVTHAPPRGIHDREDLTHQGINAFNWLLKVFRPAYHFHGHIHLYRPDAVLESRFGSTLIINTFGFRETVLEGLQPAVTENQSPRSSGSQHK